MEKVQIVDSKKSKETKESRKVDVPSDVMAELTFRCTKHMTVRGIGRSGLATLLKKVSGLGWLVWLLYPPIPNKVHNIQ